MVGTGGGETDADFVDDERVEGSQVAIEQEMGVLFMTLGSRGSYSFRFESTEGVELDSGSDRCNN